MNAIYLAFGRKKHFQRYLLMRGELLYTEEAIQATRIVIEFPDLRLTTSSE